MIPKTIHYCWFGHGEKSSLSRACMDTWKRMLPNYTIREWTEKDLAAFKNNRYVLEAYKARKWAFVSDVIRLHAIYTEGGIYFDTDVEVRRSFDDLLDCAFFIGSEKFGRTHHVGTAVIAAEKGHPLVREMLEVYNDIPFVQANGRYDTTPNTNRLIDVFLQNGFSSYYSDDAPIRRGRDIIYPVGMFSAKSADSYAIHHFEGSWLEDYRYSNKLVLPWGDSSRLELRKYKRQKERAKPIVFEEHVTPLFRFGDTGKCLYVLVKKEV